MMGKVNFFCENIQYDLKHRGKLRIWINSVVAGFNWTIGEVNYIFCNDEYLLDFNKKYLNHDTLTDIITFPLHEVAQQIKGEIYISIPRVFENAKKFGVATEFELHRVMVHGILHLLGFKDKSKEQKVQMRRLEERCLLYLQNMLTSGAE